MIPINHCVAALYAAGRLAKLDASAIDDFDTTPTGFWRSFYAALFVAPFSMMMAAAHWGRMDGDSFGRYVAVEIIAYVIAWTAFPVVMASVVKMIDREAYYIRGIVAYNWAAVLQHAVYTPIAVATINSGGGLGPLAFIVFLAVLFYGWFVIRQALNIAPWTAFSLVGLDLVIGIVVSYWSDRLSFG